MMYLPVAMYLFKYTGIHLVLLFFIGCTYDNFVAELQSAGSKGEGRYGVFDFNYTVKERIVNKIVFFLWYVYNF